MGLRGGEMSEAVKEALIQDAIDALEAAVSLPWISKEYQAVGEMCESALEGLRRIQ